MQIKSIKRINKLPVFDITVEKAHNFFCTDSKILIHNSGKSTLALEATKSFTNYWDKKKEKNVVLWIETESALDKVRAKWIGCNVEKFLISEVETVEDGFDVISATLKKCVEKKIKLFIVWDTIAAAPTKNEKDKGPWGGGISEKSRVIRAALRNITGDLGKSDATLILVNQMYHGIGMFATDESPGGGGIKFHSSVRSKLKKTQDIQQVMPNGETKILGIKTEITHVKNKLTLPRQQVLLSIQGETGLDRLDTCLNFLKTAKIINSKGGGWVTLEIPDTKGKNMPVKFQGVKGLKDTVEQNPRAKDWIDYLIYQHSTKSSPFIKLKIIDKVWEYEKMFFKETKTELTEREVEIAKLIHKDLIKDTK